jgi:uncharacterized hydrophobic protein (TIGR00271 family)
MSVLVIVTDPSEARPLLAWAETSARALSTNLLVLCCIRSDAPEDSRTVRRPDEVDDPLVAAAWRVLDELRDGGPQEKTAVPDTTVRMVRHPNPLTPTLQEIRAEGVELVFASVEADSVHSSGGTLPAQLLRHSPCHTVLISTTGARSTSAARILVATTDSPDDRTAVAVAHRYAKYCDGSLAVSVAETVGGQAAEEIGQRELDPILRDAGVDADDTIQRQVVLGDDALDGIIGIANDYDLVVLGSKNYRALPRLLASIPDATIAVFRKAPPLRSLRSRSGLTNWVPILLPADYADLVRNLRSGSRLSMDYVVMLGLAVAIASMGLLLNSPAVVIGSMLLAPMMTPMLGTGLALVQGNAQLARAAARAIGLGICMSLLVSFTIGWVMPGDELTPELLARGSPNLLDLFIALASAAAGAYALARPNIAGAIAGVAIATALVPPLCTWGISLAECKFANAFGAAMLFATNLLAIIIGGALVFRVLGVTAPAEPGRPNRWVRYVLFLVVAALLVLGFPLSVQMARQIRTGVTRSLALPVTKETYDAIQRYLDEEQPDVTLVGAARPATERAVDVRLLLSSESPLPQSVRNDLVEIVRSQRGDNNLRVSVLCFQDHWEDTQPGRSPAADPAR